VRRHVALLAASLAFTEPALAQTALAQTAPAETSAAVSTLLRQTERWLAQNRADLAASSITRALAADPGNADALLLAARVETTRGNRDAALGHLRRAQSSATSDTQRSAASAALRGSTLDPVGLEQARRLARDGRADEAAARYRALFGADGPSPDYAREYYQALSSGAGTRAEGLAGLNRLAAAPNADLATQIASAEAATYQESTRLEGIARLRALADRPETAAGAQRAWKQALGFMGQDAQTASQITAYLAKYPADPEMTQRLAALQQQPRPAATAPTGPSDSQRQEAFTQLEAGNLRTAAENFTAVLTANPADADALGGLGVLRLREGKLDEARKLLERAIAADPSRATQWQKALAGASYGAELAQGRALLARGDLVGADVVLRQATRRDVPDSADAETLLGDVLLRQKDPAAAEQHYRAALSRRPGFPPATAGLNQAQRAQGRAESRIAEQAPTRPPQLPGFTPQPPAPIPAPIPAPTGRVAELRAQAAAAGDTNVAISLLRAAVEQAPGDPWVRLDLARALKHQGRGAEGQALVEETAAQIGSADARFAAALLAQEDGRLDQADAQLSAIPPLRRTPDMARLQARVRTDRDVTRAALQSDNAAGRQQMMLIATRPDPSGATGAAVIRAFGDLNDKTAATEAARVALAANPTTGNAARLAIAGALLSAGAEGEASAMAEQLSQASLTADQRRDLASLRTGIAIRSSDRLNESGSQAQGFERLRGILAQDPDNPEGQLALARLYQGARQPAEALRLAQNVLSRDPRNFAARQGAVEAALAMGDRATAKLLATDTQTIGGTDSRMLYLQARIANAAGDTGTGERLLQQSLSLRQSELGIDAGSGDPSAPKPAPNPFLRTGDPAVTGAGMPRDSLSRQIVQELVAIQAANTPQAGFAPAVHTRSGSAGLDQLAVISSTINGVIPTPSIGGQITARIEPTLLNSGQLGGSLATLYKFGSNPLLGANPVVPKNVTANGVGFDVGYALGDVLKVSAGTTPLGFHSSNLIGGLEIAPRLSEQLRLRVTGDRHAVTDSLLSWAGLTDPVTRTTWGSVVSTGGRAQIEGSVGAGSAYVGGGYAVLTGQNVASNNRTEAGAGFAYPIIKEADATLSTGMDLVYFGFANNQRAFTLGNGGYFSPQSYGAINIPLDYRATAGRFSYRVGTTVGYASFRENSSLVFPRNADLQGQLAVVAQTNTQLSTRNPALTRNGFIGGVRIDLAYQLTDAISIGALMRYDQAPQFDETNVVIRLSGRF